MSNDRQIHENLVTLFDRPQEPVFYPKGTKKLVFDVPQNYLVNLNFIFIINFIIIMLS